MPGSRTIVAGIVLCGLSWALGGSVEAADAPPFRISQRGVATLPQSVTDRDGREVPITGLSGITWLGDDRYAAIMDNSDKLLLFTLPVGPDGAPGQPSDLEVVTLAERHDYEDVAVCPPPLQERIVARQLRNGLPDPGRCLLVAEEDTPAIRAVSLADGALLGVIPIPEIFSTRRPNRGLESLDIDPDGRHIWTANEEALPADGPAATAGSGTLVRLARIAIPKPAQQERDAPLQLPYAVDPPHGFIGVFPDDPLSGVVAIAGLGGGQLLVLERSGCPGLPPFENRIYLVDTAEAQGIARVGNEGGSERAASPLPKTLLWQDQLGCNVEGLCAGKPLRERNRALLGIADNNGIGMPNQIIAFTLEKAPSGVSVPLLVGGAAALVVVVAAAALRLAP